MGKSDNSRIHDPPVRSSPLRITVLISGRGTTLANLVEKIGTGSLDARLVGVVSSSPHAGGLEIARRAGVPTHVVDDKAFTATDEFSRAVFDRCRQEPSDLVVMGGFLKLVLIPNDFRNRVINIHPSLVPAFCGQGFYGTRVHQAVLDYGAKVSGCTVHFVDNQYDHGPVILQRALPVRDDDTPESLAGRVFALECEAYPEAIRLVAAGRLKVVGRRVIVLPP